MKTLSLTQLFMLITVMAFAQTTSTLVYDQAANKVTAPQGTDLSKGTYKFKITGLNNAFHTGKFNPEFLDRIGTLPAGLTGPISAPTFNSASSTIGAAAKTFTGYSLMTTPGDPNIIALTDQIRKEYDFIGFVVTATKDLNTFVKATWSNTTLCVLKEVDLLTAISNKAVSLGLAQIITTADLQKLLDNSVTNLINNVKVLHEEHNWSSQISPIDLGKIYDQESFVKDKEADLKSCPKIFDAVKNCVNFIYTDPYDISSDFLRLNIVVLQNKFDSKPDTLLKQKMIFYRTSYFKVLDISTGFFYDNLYSKSYYYRDTLGHYSTEKKSNSDIAIGALIHGYYVVSSSFKAGFGVGGAVSLLDGKTKYLFGPSFVFGKKQEFVISGGAAVASLAIPSNVLTNGQKFTSANTGAAVPIYNSVTWGYFVGLSYSLIKL